MNRFKCHLMNNKTQNHLDMIRSRANNQNYANFPFKFFHQHKMQFMQLMDYVSFWYKN